MEVHEKKRQFPQNVNDKGIKTNVTFHGWENRA